MELWRQKGPLGKLHNIVVFIQRSPQRKELFLQLSHGRHLVRDQQTRWNSWFAMIDRALQPDLKIAIDLYCFHYKADAQLDTLTTEDWIRLEHIHEVLQAFQEATLAAEGRMATLERVLPAMDYLLDHLEQQKIKYIGDSFMMPMINLGWMKLNQYYSWTERSAVYTAAMVLIPSQKWTYFDTNWPVEWVVTARAAVQELWKSQYKAAELPILDTFEEATKPKTGLQKWWEQKQQQAPVMDEYLRYCDASCTPVVDSRAWWLEQRTTYPALTIMALDILSIPAMEAEPERLFSGAKITMTDKRNQMKAETLEALESLKSWLGGHCTAWLDNLE